MNKRMPLMRRCCALRVVLDCRQDTCNTLRTASAACSSFTKDAALVQGSRLLVDAVGLAHLLAVRKLFWCRSTPMHVETLAAHCFFPTVHRRLPSLPCSSAKIVMHAAAGVARMNHAPTSILACWHSQRTSLFNVLRSSTSVIKSKSSAHMGWPMVVSVLSWHKAAQP